MQGHEIESASNLELIGILQSSPVLERLSQPTGTLAVLKEYSTALLWVDAPTCSPAAMKSIPEEARAMLYALFGLVKTQDPAQL
jgi:hypothetical protein